MAKQSLVEGLYTALVTPFDDQLQIDETSWRRLLDFQASGKVNGVVVSGTTGESPTLNSSEFDFLVRSAREHLGNNIRLWVGTGTNVTEASIQRSKRAAELGADGLLLVTPYYNKPTQAGLKHHFFSIADSVDLPVMLYNVPGRTGTLIETDSILELSRHPNIVASKEATGNMSQILDLITNAPDDYSILAGDDPLTLPVIAAGGTGVVSVTSNIVPGLMQALVKDSLAGNLDSAKQINKKLWPLMNAAFSESNPIPVKSALGLMGVIHPYLRPPLSQLSEPNQKRLKQVLTDLNLIE